MGKKEFVARRVLQIVVLYFVIGSVLFAMLRLAPGSPMANFMSPNMDAEQIAQIEAQFGLADPWYVQYGKWLQNLATFNYGLSFVHMEPVIDRISGRLVNTLVLMLTSIVIAYAIAVPFGAWLAWNRGSSKEEAGVLLTLFSRSAPVFWTGLIMLYIFGYVLGVLPAGGMGSRGIEYSSRLDMYLNVDFLKHLFLPALVQSFYYFSLPTLLMRNSMLEVMNEDFVEFADLKGVSDRKVMIKHAARNALLPVVTAFAIGAAYAIGGSVVIETVFDWPGLGREIVRAILQNDYPVAQGAFMLLATMVLLANLFADIAYGYLDPRVTYD